MTKKTKTILERGISGSIQKQEKVFFDNFITKALFKKIEKRGARSNSF